MANLSILDANTTTPRTFADSVNAQIQSLSFRVSHRQNGPYTRLYALAQPGADKICSRGLCGRAIEAYRHYGEERPLNDVINRYSAYAKESGARQRGDCARYIPEINLLYPLMCAEVPTIPGVSLDIGETQYAYSTVGGASNRDIKRVVSSGALWMAATGASMDVWVEISVDKVPLAPEGGSTALQTVLAHNYVDSAVVDEVGVVLGACSGYKRDASNNGFINWTTQVAGDTYVTTRILNPHACTLRRYVTESVSRILSVMTTLPEWVTGIENLVNMLNYNFSVRCTNIQRSIANYPKPEGPPSKVDGVGHIPIPVRTDGDSYVLDVDPKTGLVVNMELVQWDRDALVQFGSIQNDRIYSNVVESSGGAGARIAADISASENRGIAKYVLYLFGKYMNTVWSLAYEAVEHEMYAELHRIYRETPLQRFDNLREAMKHIQDDVLTQLAEPRFDYSVAYNYSWNKQYDLI